MFPEAHHTPFSASADLALSRAAAERHQTLQALTATRQARVGRRRASLRHLLRPTTPPRSTARHPGGLHRKAAP